MWATELNNEQWLLGGEGRITEIKINAQKSDWQDAQWSAKQSWMCGAHCSHTLKIIFSIQKPVIVGIHIFSASVSLASPLCATDHHFVLFRCQKLRMRDDSMLQFWITEWEWRGWGSPGSNTSVDTVRVREGLNLESFFINAEVKRSAPWVRCCCCHDSFNASSDRKSTCVCPLGKRGAGPRVLQWSRTCLHV